MVSALAFLPLPLPLPLTFLSLPPFPSSSLPPSVPSHLPVSLFNFLHTSEPLSLFPLPEAEAEAEACDASAVCILPLARRAFLSWIGGCVYGRTRAALAGTLYLGLSC